MHRFQFPRTCLASLLLAVAPLLLNAQAPRPEAVGLQPDAPTYARHGPYWVGAREFVIRTSVEGRSLAATLWYPALNPKGMKEANTYTFDGTGFSGEVLTISGHALVDAPPDSSGGPYPLVVFSHGDGNSRVLSTYFMEHLASHGFTALGIDHLKPDSERPKDVKCAIDFAEKIATAAPAFAGLVDAAQVAAAGHSCGGLTALLAGGAKFQGGLADFTDSRVKALIPMASGMKAGGLDLASAPDAPKEFGILPPGQGW